MSTNDDAASHTLGREDQILTSFKGYGVNAVLIIARHSAP
jgi:hypothetical protein